MKIATRRRTESGFKRSEMALVGVVFLVIVAVLPSWVQSGFRIPFLPRARTSSGRSCITNLKQIDGASQQWALEYGKSTTDTYSFSDTKLLAFLKGSVLPKCPQGGRYTAGTNLLDPPKCNIPGHTL